MIELPDPSKGTDEEKMAWLMRELERDKQAKRIAIRLAFGRYYAPGVSLQRGDRFTFLPYAPV